MNILYVTASDLSSVGGDTQHVLAILRGLAELGNQVHLVARGDPKIPGIDTRVAHGHGLLGGFLRTAILCRSIIREKLPDVLYLRPFPLDGYLLAGGLPAELRLVIELNSLMSAEIRLRHPTLTPIVTRSERRAVRRADAWIATTPEIATTVGRHAKVLRPWLIGKNGFDPEDLAGLPHDAPDGDRDVLVMLGFERPWHGADRAIEMLRHVSPPAELWLVGGGGSRPQQDLQAQAATLGLRKRVRFFPRMPPREAAELASRALIGVGSLGLDRLGMSQAQPIKTRQYAALGLSVLGNYEDPYLPSELPFVGSVPSASPMALAEGVGQLRETARAQRESAHDYAYSHLTWKHASSETNRFLLDCL